MVSAVVPADKSAAVPEVAAYLKESVGNSTRIDYGTGESQPVGFTQSAQINAAAQFNQNHFIL